jgi:hypothetical protein
LKYLYGFDPKPSASGRTGIKQGFNQFLPNNGFELFGKNFKFQDEG